MSLILRGTEGITFPDLTGQATASTSSVPNCGRLARVSATQLSFTPYNGDKIKINGALYDIPSAGIAGLANTGIFLAGVAGQSLANNTVYLVSAFINAGAVTADFHALSLIGHSTSTTTGNIGTEIKTGFDTHSIIGMVRTIAAAAFADLPTNRLVINWFNRRQQAVAGTTTANIASSSVAIIEISSTARAGFLKWGEDDMAVGLAGWTTNTVAGNYTNSMVGLDGAATLLTSQVLGGSAFASGVAGVGAYGAVPAATVSEGYHYITLAGAVNASAGNWTVGVSGMVRG